MRKARKANLALINSLDSKHVAMFFLKMFLLKFPYANSKNETFYNNNDLSEYLQRQGIPAETQKKFTSKKRIESLLNDVGSCATNKLANTQKQLNQAKDMLRRMFRSHRTARKQPILKWRYNAPDSSNQKFIPLFYGYVLMVYICCKPKINFLEEPREAATLGVHLTPELRTRILSVLQYTTNVGQLNAYFMSIAARGVIQSLEDTKLFIEHVVPALIRQNRRDVFDMQRSPALCDWLMASSGIDLLKELFGFENRFVQSDITDFDRIGLSETMKRRETLVNEYPTKAAQAIIRYSQYLVGVREDFTTQTVIGKISVGNFVDAFAHADNNSKDAENKVQTKTMSTKTNTATLPAKTKRKKPEHKLQLEQNHAKKQKKETPLPVEPDDQDPKEQKSEDVDSKCPQVPASTTRASATLDVGLVEHTNGSIQSIENISWLQADASPRKISVSDISTMQLANDLFARISQELCFSVKQNGKFLSNGIKTSLLIELVRHPLIKIEGLRKLLRQLAANWVHSMQQKSFQILSESQASKNEQNEPMNVMVQLFAELDCFIEECGPSIQTLVKLVEQ